MRGGADSVLPLDREHGFVHTAENVYVEMLLQICRHYAGLPDPRSLTIEEILFFYEGLRPELKRATAPKTSK